MNYISPYTPKYVPDTMADLSTTSTTSESNASHCQSKAKIVRRVHAVIEVPVKEEEQDPQDLFSSNEGEMPLSAQPRPRKSLGKHTKRPAKEEEYETDEDGSGEYVENQAKARRVRRPSGASSASRRGMARAKGDHPADDDEDELEMGSEVR